MLRLKCVRLEEAGQINGDIKMIYLITIPLDLNHYNIQKQSVMKQHLAHKELTIRVIRTDGLIEEKSCTMINFLKFMGFNVSVNERKES